MTITPVPIAWNEVRTAFQKIWGYSDFRPPQGEIIQTLLAQEDSLIIMPTGGGKSICFQLPALLQTGLTLVISPLVALMENQVQELRQKRLPAALLHGELSSGQRRQTLHALEQQRLRLLYLSPETLLSPAVWERLIHPTLKLNGLILDEAHCLVQWGEAFRPVYYRLGSVRPTLLKYKPDGTRLPIAAFTATADLPTQDMIQHVLGLEQPRVFRSNPYRPNLRLAVQTVWTPHHRRRALLHFIRQQPDRSSGLVYVRTRHDTETLSAWLRQKGYTTASYHAGLSPEDRRAIEQNWLTDRTPIVVCTNAFGMGVNKPAVRWVAHAQAPFLLAEYLQEVGRAGRDGKPAVALSLFSEPTGWLDPSDKQRWQFFANQLQKQQHLAEDIAKKLPLQGEIGLISKQFPAGEAALSSLYSRGQLEWVDPFRYAIKPGPSQGLTQPDRALTQAIATYARTKQCRWAFLLHAFGFATEARTFRCDTCDNCRP